MERESTKLYLLQLAGPIMNVSLEEFYLLRYNVV
jgi:hypothetical protein